MATFIAKGLSTNTIRLNIEKYGLLGILPQDTPIELAKIINGEFAIGEVLPDNYAEIIAKLYVSYLKKYDEMTGLIDEVNYVKNHMISSLH